MRVSRVESSLHARTWSFNRGPEVRARQLLLLSDGGGEIESGGERLAVAAPALGWAGRPAEGRARVDAGATGYRATVSEAMLAAAIGDVAEAGQLAQLTGRSFVLSLAGREAEAESVRAWLELALLEAERPGDGTAAMLSAYLRIVLVTLMRLAAGLPMERRAGTGEADALLHRFRQLVETNFRGHWPVARYAGALGISTDRLHAICTRATGRSPKALVSERLAREAAARLPRSSLTIEQLGFSLGFADPAAFNRFFRRVTGVPPGQYRKLAASAEAGGAKAPRLNFDDWP